MAKQTKSLTCHPDDENELIDLWQAFGWTLFSTQEVRDSESHLESGWDNSVKSVTTTTHYIKLTFQRDPSEIKNYQELVALENQFNSVPGPGDYPKKYNILQILIGLLICTLPGIFMIVRNISIGKKQKQWEADYAVYTSKRREIYQRALQLSEA